MLRLYDENEWKQFEAFKQDYETYMELIKPDPVNHPTHYTKGEIECIDAIKASMDTDGFKGYLKGNAIKYLWRYEHKGGIEDLDKCTWYVNRLIEEEWEG